MVLMQQWMPTIWWKFSWLIQPQSDPLSGCQKRAPALNVDSGNEKSPNINQRKLRRIVEDRKNGKSISTMTVNQSQNPPDEFAAFYQVLEARR